MLTDYEYRRGIVRELNYSAKTTLPDFFSKSPAEQTKFLGIISKIIALHTSFTWKENTQKKWSYSKDNSFINPLQLLYSLVALKDREGNFHYFNKPHKKEGLIGKGNKGYVLAAYELQAINDQWHLPPDIQPSIALKILRCNPVEFKEQYEKIILQMKIMSDFYETPFPFSEPFFRLVSNKSLTEQYYKFYIPMIYWPGENGDDFVKNGAKIAADKSIKNKLECQFNYFLKGQEYSIAIIEEVNRFHDKGYIHGDIKPENFRLHKGTARLVDFDFSRKNSEICDSRKDGMTRWFIPPEFLENQQWTRKGEIYAVGLTIYELLGGRNLFENLTEDEFYKCLKEARPRNHADFIDWLPIEDKPKKFAKTEINAQINALTYANPEEPSYGSSKRATLPEVSAALRVVLKMLQSCPLKAQILDEIEVTNRNIPAQQYTGPGMFKLRDPEEPPGERLRTTPSPAPEFK